MSETGISVKQAVEFARQSAEEMLGQQALFLEEAEREMYRDRDCWAITLSFLNPRGEDVTPAAMASLLKLTNRYLYKRFFVDAETGEVLGMRIRETALK